MKKIITLLLLAALALPVLAQKSPFGSTSRSRYSHAYTEYYYGLRLGLNVATLSSDNVRFDTDSRTGVAFGAVFGRQLASNTPLWLELGLQYSEKGGRNHAVTRAGEQVARRVTDRLCYIEAPIVCKYSFEVYDDFNIQPFMGGYLALGIAGKTKEYGTYSSNYEDRSSHSVYDGLTRFDGGLRIGCGAEYQMVYAELGFDFGLADIATDDFDSVHTRNFFINIGVNF